MNESKIESLVSDVKESVNLQFPARIANLCDLVRIPGIAWDAFDAAELERSAEAVKAQEELASKRSVTASASRTVDRTSLLEVVEYDSVADSCWEIT